MFEKADESVKGLERVLEGVLPPDSEHKKITGENIGYLKGFLDMLRSTVADVPQPYAGMISRLGDSDVVIGSDTHTEHTRSEKREYRLTLQEIYNYLKRHEGETVTAAAIYISVTGEHIPLSKGNMLLMRERVRPHINNLKSHLPLDEAIISYRDGSYEYISKKKN